MDGCRGEGTVEGHAEGTMDGTTQIKAETVRARLIAATLEVLSGGNDPRLGRMRHTPRIA
jgi:hypothetical protein